MVLLLIPEEKVESPAVSATAETPIFSESEYVHNMEERLCNVLSEIQNVGKVQVFLTLKQGEKIHYLSDRDYKTDTGSDKATAVEESEKAVIISSGSTYDEAIITKRDYPLFQGALIVCEGGGNAEVKLQLTLAISALTNLSSDKITILKMK